jgi:nucleoside-diphosphate-sugar epimerase
MTVALVTGGAGFIGSHLVRDLTGEGYDVRVLDNLSTGLKENLEAVDVEWFLGDIRDEGLVEQAVKDVDIIFHYAAMISAPGSIEDPSFCYDVNVLGSLNILWKAHHANVRKVVLASSAAVYGESANPVSEDFALDPKSPYASSKIAMEGLATMFTTTYGLPTVCLRFFNIYGPRQSPDSPYAAAIPLFIRALESKSTPTIFGDGMQTRDFVFVQDVVRANILAVESETTSGGIFNIAGFGPVTIHELFQLLSGFYDDPPSPEYGSERAGDIRHSAANQEKAQKALGYRPEIALEQGLQRTVQWFRSKGTL